MRRTHYCQLKQIKERNIVKECFWNNQSSVLICMYTLCSFYSLFLYKDREIWSRLVYFLLNGLCVRQKVDFHWLVVLFQIFFFGGGDKTLKVRTFSIGKTRFLRYQDEWNAISIRLAGILRFYCPTISSLLTIVK